MNTKKLLPYILLAVLVIAALAIRQCGKTGTTNPSARSAATSTGLDRNRDDLFFTKHARCRMTCRPDPQEKVKKVWRNGTLHQQKSDLQDARGPEYAVEGDTKDGQHVRIIFAPKQKHISVVTVIDLENEWNCPSCN